MNFTSELLIVNQKIASKGIKLRIEQRGKRLCLRGPLPCQKNPNKTKDQRISLGLDANIKELQQAEKTLHFLYLQIQHNQFDWKHWSTSKSKISTNKKFLDVEEAIKDFELFFFNDPIRNKSKAGSRTNWKCAYLPYLRRLSIIAQSNNESLNKNLFLKTLSSYSENSRSRQQCGTTLKALAKYSDIQLPENWRDLAYGYGLHQARFRKLPSDSLIEKTFFMIPNPRWRLVYGLMATYGLRNHEVFFCDLSCLSEGEDKILRVFPNTKTGEHQVWPFQPEWINRFKLNALSYETNLLPEINTDLNKTTLQNVGRRVSEQFRRYNLPLTPYDLRHAWAVRTIHIGLPDSVAARMMGHSVAIHTRTYHHWITRRDQQQAVDKALGGKNL
ncbi:MULTISPECIES: site-specific integrase [Prochlorococcus]|uniref:XisA-like site specific recombinase from phage integrase family n=1 Tax=Prochlorococcus marinus (strain SARG / CCMP1375 / SS120) TaxID=167539 RepID=Q7VD59_PROMA|nr:MULTISPECIES: site-specific integrase [Prochlorococcus]AAP99569.1 XisA-like site specific recombinase from phage integrase family [Prochlorococcus marinus subsp. marinus str. CCMP1375]KGG11159.1 Phage integrase family [Prochlorococcus marinus str. LG]KGG21497.1 Phage integrase family [Prochlorococcus marinus str. SS2]KGG23158.1 Phage integrase family [Prochlorococcus marinus str. SS35]KGG33869.1 Phage integrase family [Prochlorococcus marinus str. SS51]